MLLVIDIGNSNITYGMYDNNTIVKVFRTESDIKISSQKYKALIKEQTSGFNIKNCVIASVVEELNIVLKTTLDNLFDTNTIILTQESNLGINLTVEHPETAGMDRIANVISALKRYGAPAIVVDAGTAITFDVIDKNGDFTGGIIMPGIRLQLQSLGNNTSKLPILEIEDIKNVIGKDTKTNILSGVIRGTACAIDGLFEQCCLELSYKPLFIGTGGNIDILSKYMKTSFDYVEQNLTLDGIKFIYELNKS